MWQFMTQNSYRRAEPYREILGKCCPWKQITFRYLTIIPCIFYTSQVIFPVRTLPHHRSTLLLWSLIERKYLYMYKCLISCLVVPMAMPSVKLCTPSPMITIQAMDDTDVGAVWLWPCPCSWGTTPPSTSPSTPPSSSSSSSICSVSTPQVSASPDSTICFSSYNSISIWAENRCMAVIGQRNTIEP